MAKGNKGETLPPPMTQVYESDIVIEQTEKDEVRIIYSEDGCPPVKISPKKATAESEPTSVEAVESDESVEKSSQAQPSAPASTPSIHSALLPKFDGPTLTFPGLVSATATVSGESLNFPER